ncbi:hypothetical protein [Variovorax sp. DT-64]
MTAVEIRLIERLEHLPAVRVSEALDLVDFQTEREQRATSGHAINEVEA